MLISKELISVQPFPPPKGLLMFVDFKYDHALGVRKNRKKKLARVFKELENENI